MQSANMIFYVIGAIVIVLFILLVISLVKRPVFMLFAQFYIIVFVDIYHARCYSKVIKGKEPLKRT